MGLRYIGKESSVTSAKSDWLEKVKVDRVLVTKEMSEKEIFLNEVTGKILVDKFAVKASCRGMRRLLSSWNKEIKRQGLQNDLKYIGSDTFWTHHRKMYLQE